MFCTNRYDRNNRHPKGCGYKNQARLRGLEYSKSAQADFVPVAPGFTLGDSGVGMLVVIDPSVADYQFLAAGVLPGAETIVLEPHRDAIAQITMALTRHREYQSLHIVCHGEPGKLYLGKTCLSGENLAPYRQQLLEWGVGEILLYSCEVAAGNVGTAFVEQLSRLTGADIAASPRRVGNADLGGSWHLESYSGEVSSGVAFVPDVVREYSGVFTIKFSTRNTYLVNEADSTFVGDPITIERTDSSQPITVDVVFGTPLDTAIGGPILIPGVDYVNTTQTVTFAAGQTSAVVGLDINPDGLREGAEAFGITLRNATGSEPIDPIDFSKVNILEISSFNLVGFTLANYQVNEDGTAVRVPVTIERAGFTKRPSNIDVQLIDGTATGGVDFDNTTISVKFAAGETNKTVTVPILPDNVSEDTENLTLQLVNGSSGTVLGLQNSTTLEILDDDINNSGFLFNYNGYLTEPSDEDPLDIALNFLRENHELLGLTAADVQNPIVTNQQVTQHNGATHIYLAQELNGEKVFNGNMSLTVTNDGRLLSVGNRFGNNLAENFNTAVPQLSPASAVEAAAADSGLNFDSPPQEIFFFAPVPQDFTFDGGNVSRDNIPVTLMYDIGDDGTASLVWNTVINTTNSDDWWEMNVDAVTGDVLQKNNWTNDANYKVFAHPHEHPEDPLYGTGTFDFRTIEGDPHDPIASPFGWHDTNGALGAEYTDTRGNNVFAQEDRDGNNTGGYRPDGGNALNFDFPLDLSSNPIGYEDAAITNLFYWNNKLHDIFFHYGFDEAAGNFQETNYTAAPGDSDAVRADAQDRFDLGTRNNANFATPPDGMYPRMQMYVFDITTPLRDSALDNTVIIHEYGHGVSNRLTGGAGNSSALQANQSRSMGEGWSDFFAMALTMKPMFFEDTSSDSYPIGNYVLGQDPVTGGGIRNYPYSTDMTVNPLTYEDITTTNIPHGGGEIWAATLLDLYWNFVDNDAACVGVSHSNPVIQLVVDGLKLQPANPTFLDARDAILQADLLNNGGAYQELIWETFARRGMGLSAQDGGSAYSLNVVNAFDIPPITLNNRAPEVTTALMYTNKPIPVTYPNADYPLAVFTDPDGDPLSYQISQVDGSDLPDWLNFQVTPGSPDQITFSFNWTPPATIEPFYVHLMAEDPSGASACQVFQITSTKVIDGYIGGATVFFDANKNGILDDNEPFAYTDVNGNYDLVIPSEFDINNNGQFDSEDGNIVAIGGIDTAHGLPLETPLTATPDATVVTLLTSLVADLVNDPGLTVEEANAKITTALGLSSDASLNYTDPIVATRNDEPGGIETFTAMVQVQNFITQTMGLISGASTLSNGEIVEEVVRAITSEIQSNTTLDLTDASQLEAIILDAGNRTNVDLSQIAAQAALVMAAANQRIADIAANTPIDLIETEFAKVQKIALGETTSDLKEAAAGSKNIAEVVAENTGAALDDQIENAQVQSNAPTDLELSDNTVAENQPIGTEVGTFSTIDPDAGETHSYSLVPGEGDTDNDSFEIVDNSLRTSETFDYETQDAYNIRVQTTDGNGGVYWEQFTIDVSDAEDPPPGDQIDGTPRRDNLVGTEGDDIITGFQGRDTLTGGTGSDQFVYTSILDAGDIITDFEVGVDKIVLSQFLDRLGYDGTNPLDDGYIGLRSRGGDTIITIDPDGPGSGRARSLIRVQNVSDTALDDLSNFVF